MEMRSCEPVRILDGHRRAVGPIDADVNPEPCRFSLSLGLRLADHLSDLGECDGRTLNECRNS